MEETYLVISGKILKKEKPEPDHDKLFNSQTTVAYRFSYNKNESKLHKHLLSDNEYIKIILSDGVAFYLGMESFMSLIPETEKGKKEIDALACIHQLRSQKIKKRSHGIVIDKIKFITLKPVNNKLQSEDSFDQMIGHIEQQVCDSPGLYRCSPYSFEMSPVNNPQTRISTNKPVLVLIHGTASNTRSSFLDLWNSLDSPLWKEHVEETYGDEVYAFEHRTLSESPIENACHLVSLLPAGVELHLVTHSRGGLIGELLARGQVEEGQAPFTEEEITLQDEKDQGALRQLGNLLTTKKIRIKRYVRVACPVRGATFTNHRLDVYFSILLNTLNAIPSLKNNEIYFAATQLLNVLLFHKSKPQDLRGLKAMLPNSRLIQILNGSLVRSDSDLSIISGDIENAGVGVFKTLEIVTTRLFFIEQHDLLVSTSSMTGGVLRKKNSGRCFHQGPQVSHFHYFSNSTTLQCLIDGLAWKNDRPDSYELLQQKHLTKAPRKRSLFDPEKPIVILLPGIFGSHLKSGNERIWFDWKALTKGKLTQLDVEVTHEDTAESLLEDKYADLISFLEKQFNVIPFPFDWRLSHVSAAKTLKETIQSYLESDMDDTSPIHLLAHSTGGLVAQLMISDNQDLWKTLTDRGSRLLMLGTPIGGSYVIPSMLLGEHRLNDLLKLICYRQANTTVAKTLKATKAVEAAKEFNEIIAQFPGFLELLPQNSDIDFLNLATWNELLQKEGSGGLLSSENLSKASKVLKKLRNTNYDTEHIFYVGGSGQETPDGYDIKEHRFTHTWDGDGFTVRRKGNVPGASKCWYSNASHGDLANQEENFQAYYEILSQGDTQFASTASTQTNKHPEGQLSQGRSVIFPEEQELIDTAMSVTRLVTTHHDLDDMLNVEVTHGDLRHAQYTLVAGHHDGDSLSGSYDDINQMMGGLLQESYDMGLFPGPINTVDIFLKPGGKHHGVVLLGLGRIGTLSANKLQETITHGLLSYVRMLHERELIQDDNLGVSFLLITNGISGLPIEDICVAILRGVITVNHSLETNHYGAIKIRNVEIIDLYLDQAVKAVYALKSMYENNEFKSIINLNPSLQFSFGGRERIANLPRTNRWQSLQIIKTVAGTLRFTYLTRKARAEAVIMKTQRKLMDKMIKSSINTTNSHKGLAHTLYELLMPHDFKSQAPDQGDILLILDVNTSRYPWELLQRSTSEKDIPISVESGMIRQLIQEDYRHQPIQTVNKYALVIGDPETNFKPLEGAYEEAKSVVSVLEKNEYHVTDKIRAKSDEIIQSLFNKPYRIIHLAGHGVYKFSEKPAVVDFKTKQIKDSSNKNLKKKNKVASDEETYTGMVLGDGIYLSPKEIAQMQTVPDIVFVNCCHAGFIDGTTQPHKLAANIASQLIKNGVRCVVAAGWAVDDDAARQFAEEFYSEMLQKNETFGRAVQQARKHIYENFPDINTWGAYQCYGDPNFQLQAELNGNIRAINRKSLESSRAYALPKELSLELKARLDDIPGIDFFEQKEIRKELRFLIRSLPAKWRRDGLLLSSIAKFYSNLGEPEDLKQACDFYKDALNAVITNFSIDVLEDYAKTEIKLAKSLNEKGPREDKIKEAIAHLEHLSKLSPSVKRFNLLGYAYKQKALYTTGDEREWALNNTADAYDEAHKMSLKKTGVINAEALLNCLVVAIAKSWRNNCEEHLVQYTSWKNQLGSIIAQDIEENNTICNKILGVDYKLSMLLIQDKFNEDNIKTMVSAYKRISMTKNDSQKINHLTDTLSFLHCMSETANKGMDKAIKANANLTQLLNQVSAFV